MTLRLPCFLQHEDLQRWNAAHTKATEIYNTTIGAAGHGYHDAAGKSEEAAGHKLGFHLGTLAENPFRQAQPPNIQPAPKAGDPFWSKCVRRADWDYDKAISLYYSHKQGAAGLHVSDDVVSARRAPKSPDASDAERSAESFGSAESDGEASPMRRAALHAANGNQVCAARLIEHIVSKGGDDRNFPSEGALKTC